MVQNNRDPRAYELMTVVLPDMPEEETTAAIERINSFVTNQGGEIKESLTDSPWGRRRLAYTMRYQGVDYRDGYYTLTHFSAKPDVIHEIERELKLDNQVVRYLLIIDDPRVGEKEIHREEDETTETEAAPADESAAPAEAAAEATDASTPAGEAEGRESDSATPDKDVAEEVAEKIEGEEKPAPADAPATEAAAPTTKRTAASKLPAEGEGVEWVSGDGTDNVPETFPLKGNASSKIYHPQESPNYSNTVAEIYFASPEVAEQHGYRLPKVLQNAADSAAAAAADLAKTTAAEASEEE